MDRQRYIEEGYHQINDTSVYLRTHATAISDIKEDIQRLADHLHIEGIITDDIRRQNHTTRPVYFNVQFHPSLPDIKGILQKYTSLLHQSVTMKTVVPDLPLIRFSQPHNLCRSLCRATSVKPLVLMMSHLDHHKVVANHVVNYAYR